MLEVAESVGLRKQIHGDPEVVAHPCAQSALGLASPSTARGGSASAAASVSRNVEPRIRPFRWLPRMRLLSVAFPTFPDGHLAAPVAHRHGQRRGHD